MNTRYAIVLLLWSVACNVGLSQEDAKKESPIEGWKLQGGQWKVVDKGIQCDAPGSLEWLGKVENKLTVSFDVTIAEWSEGTRDLHLVGFFWGIKNPTEPYMRFLIRKDGRITIGPASSTGEKQTVAQVPLGRPIRIKAQLTKTKALVAVGKITLQGNLAVDSVGGFWLHCNGADAVFSNIKVEGK